MLSHISVQGTFAARELPCREAGALAHRARLVGVHALHLALRGGRVHDAERRAEKRGAQAAGVAVREDAGAGREQLRAVGADGAVHGLVLGLHALDLVVELVGEGARRSAPARERVGETLEAAHTPRQVHGGGTRVGHLVGHAAELREEARRHLPAPACRRRAGADVARPQRHGGRAGDAEGGGAAHGERLDGAHHGAPVARALEGELAGQAPLVDVGEARAAVAVALELDGARQVLQAEGLAHGASFLRRCHSSASSLRKSAGTHVKAP